MFRKLFHFTTKTKLTAVQWIPYVVLINSLGCVSIVCLCASRGMCICFHRGEGVCGSDAGMKDDIASRISLVSVKHFYGGAQGARGWGFRVWLLAFSAGHGEWYVLAKPPSPHVLSISLARSPCSHTTFTLRSSGRLRVHLHANHWTADKQRCKPTRHEYHPVLNVVGSKPLGLSARGSLASNPDVSSGIVWVCQRLEPNIFTILTTKQMDAFFSTCSGTDSLVAVFQNKVL